MGVSCVDVSLLLVVNAFLIGPITLVSRKTIAYWNSYSTMYSYVLIQHTSSHLRVYLLWLIAIPLVAS